jgi:hypothetical protein
MEMFSDRVGEASPKRVVSLLLLGSARGLSSLGGFEDGFSKVIVHKDSTSVL